MPFKNMLEDLVHTVPGALGAIFADWEGEAVAQAGHMDDYELKVIGAHKGVILQNLREASCRLDDDQLHEVVVTAEKVQSLILPVADEYFLVLAIRRDDVMGRALFEARRCVARLRQEIA